jgi:hypothetical protein
MRAIRSYGMRSEFGAFGATVAIMAAFGLLAAAPGARAADPSKELPSDREEIIVTHSRLGPLSDWAQMQAHTADYERLKAKFDPTTGSSHVDNWANERASAGHSDAGNEFINESADQPTPPAIKAVEDSVAP